MSVGGHLHRMYLFSLILGIVLLPEAYALTCLKCTGASCVDETCGSASQTRCAAVGAAVYLGSQKTEETSGRGCAQPQECVQGTVNFGVSSTVYTSKCCTTDRCNNAEVNAGPRPTNKNGKKCYTCVGHDCSGELSCLGTEDRCISTKVSAGGQTVNVKGCASKDICSALNMPGLSNLVGQNFNCCEGNLCNSASSTSAGLLLLMGPLISLVLFS